MPTESDLRDLFRGPDGDGGLDAGSIIRRAHRRRAPKVVAAAAGAALVVAAVVVPVAGLGLSRGGASGAAGSAGHSDARGLADRSPELKGPSATGGAGGACAAPASASVASDLAATVELADATTGSPVAGTLVLTASGGGEEVRVTGPMTVTLLRDGTVVWSGSVDLGTPRLAVSADAPARLPFTVAPVDCGSGSVLAAGAYAVEASIPVAVGDAEARAVPAAGALRIR